MKWNVRLEVGNYCNLRCPLCTRETVDKATINNINLSLKDVEKFLPRFFLHNQVDTVFLSGAVAEPTLNPDFIEIVNYLMKYSKVIIDSNGSTRDVKWWAELGATGVKCTFSPDSIKPNNNKYRINSNTDKVIENMRAFINAGGGAEWKFIPYAHNKDELEEQIKISNEIGSKFVVAQSYPVRNRTEKVEDSGLFPKDHKLVVYSENSTPHHYCKLLGEIDEYNLIEISPNGIIYPCCYIVKPLYLVYGDYFASGNTTPKVDFESDKFSLRFYTRLDSFVNSIVPLIEEQGGIESLSLHHHSINEILNSPFYKNTLKQSWSNKEHYCSKYCDHSKYANHIDYVLNKIQQ